MKQCRGITTLLLVAALAAGPFLWPSTAAQAQEDTRIVVEDLNDLPIFTYPVTGSVTELLGSDEQFTDFAAKLRAHIESTLQKYRIDDNATLQKLHGTLVTLNLLAGRDDEALREIELVRELEDKEAVRLTTGRVGEAIVAARKVAHPDTDRDAYRAAFAQYFAASISDLPWDVVQDRIQQGKGMTEIRSENFLLGAVQSQLDPVVASTGELSSDMARAVAGIRLALKVTIPLRQEIIAGYQEKIDQHQEQKQDIWAARDLTLEPGQDLQPVVVAIWDSGVDVSVFGDALFVNPAEELDGEDNDGNGFVDDRHGIAYDLDGLKTPHLLHPVGDQEGKVAGAMKHLKGVMDLQASLESEEASQLKQHLGSIVPEQVQEFIESLNFCGVYAHGTHVGGIAIAGNPYARLLAARITFDYHSIPQPLTVEIARRHARSYHEAVDYFAEHGARVANMSWGWTFTEIESGLEANGVGESAEQRKELAGEIFDILSEGLHGAIASQPGILFVSAAGNEDSDVEFDKVIPSSFDLPNLLIVGAVDQAGDRTSFTSTGENVVVFSSGFEVESYVPGGERMKMSGTSMSSPNVANLAGKLFSLRPELTPTEVIALIKEGADRKETEGGPLLINPQATVNLLP